MESLLFDERLKTDSLSICFPGCLYVYASHCLTQTSSQTTFRTISNQQHGNTAQQPELLCLPRCMRANAREHTHTHCRGLSGWCVKAHWIYFWEWHWTQDHFSLPFSFLFCTLPAASSTTSPLTIPLSIYDGVILLWYYDLLLPPWFLILPPLPYPHPFYCKLCDWQLQLQVLRWAFTSAAWLSKNLTLPPASTPISTTGLSPSNRLQVRPKKRHPNHLQGLQLDTVCASKGELAPVCFISEAEWTWDCAKT